MQGTDKHGHGDTLCAMSPHITGDFPAASGIADVDGLLQIKLFREGCEIVARVPGELLWDLRSQKARPMGAKHFESGFKIGCPRPSAWLAQAPRPEPPLATIRATVSSLSPIFGGGL